MKRKIILKKRQKSNLEKEKIEVLRDIRQGLDDLKNGRFTIEEH